MIEYDEIITIMFHSLVPTIIFAAVIYGVKVFFDLTSGELPPADETAGTPQKPGGATDRT
jgi:hypothetical protein